MAQLLVRNIEAEVVEKLRRKAAKDGISVEEVHRRILREAMSPRYGKPKPTFVEYLLRIPDTGADRVFLRSKSMPRKMTF